MSASKTTHLNRQPTLNDIIKYRNLTPSPTINVEPQSEFDPANKVAKSGTIYYSTH